MWGEQAARKEFVENSIKLSRERNAAEGSNEMQFIKRFVGANLERAESLKPADRAELKTPDRADVKTPGRADVKTPGRADVKTPGRADVKTPGRSSYSDQPLVDGYGDGWSSTHHAAADIFQRASSLGGFMVAGMIVPMPPATPSTNGYDSRVMPSASNNGDREKREAGAQQTVDRMYEGSKLKWARESQNAKSQENPRRAPATTRWVLIGLPLAAVLGLAAIGSRVRRSAPPNVNAKP